ncbi:hypothetical protein HYFRA_00011457 [Hymenoscyphus fraxineus]|uniref:Uncharacterized protein n=1 Tax=Hymenoscyphus fraxineus TaxID=746836 RepID=A0A9N9L0G6_9HELO|nr:hypothetical protein HYFRA_00011457 [Hymenoscyphus fraxineus]
MSNGLLRRQDWIKDALDTIFGVLVYLEHAAKYMIYISLARGAMWAGPWPITEPRFTDLAYDAVVSGMKQLVVFDWTCFCEGP